MNILNRDALVQLEKDTSAEIVPVILNRFLEELEKRCTDIRIALAEDDCERICLEAHSIKSASRTFGLEILSTGALKLEESADTGNTVDVAADAESLLAAADQARQALEALLAGSR